MKAKWNAFFMIFCILAIFVAIDRPCQVCAETKQAPILSLEQKKDLVILFTFDKEPVDITFLSPSGIRLTVADLGVEMAEGELWRTYRISDAEIGTWSVEYELKGNHSIEYSVIEEDYGLWLQYVKLENTNNDRMALKFQADSENRILDYGYEVYAVSMPNGDFSQKIASGRAVSNEETTEELALSSLSSGTYQLRLEVFCTDGDVELFDSMLSDSFDFSNPKEPERIEDYRVYLDVENQVCEAVWDDYAKKYDFCRLVVYGDDAEPIYDGILDGDVTRSGIQFPQDTKTLTISFYINHNGIWSSPSTKQIDLADGEYLRLGTDETAGDSQFILEYSAEKSRRLFLTVNGTESELSLTGTGYCGIALEQGSNTVYAEFESDDLVFYKIDTELYFDAYPPKIILYEALDGKTFFDTIVTITGKMTGGTCITANGEVIETDSTGEFSYPFPLSYGENELTLEAVDVNGNAADLVLTLYQAASGTEMFPDKSIWVRILPLMASLLSSMLIILISIVFMKKKEKSKYGVKKRGILCWLLLVFAVVSAETSCIYQFITHQIFVNSLKFLELAEHSVSDAAEYLRMRNMFGIISAVGFAICILFVLLTVFVGKRRKRMLP
ncbi:MAG: hypothetical protein NC548_53635 [Lachnospiraceae bacterium]|nr:hypothetical protein [Lachnospiraceae bacterium]